MVIVMASARRVGNRWYLSVDDHPQLEVELVDRIDLACGAIAAAVAVDRRLRVEDVSVYLSSITEEPAAPRSVPVPWARPQAGERCRRPGADVLPALGRQTGAAAT